MTDDKQGGPGGGLNEAALAGRIEEEPGDDSSMGTDMPSGGLLSGAGSTTAGLLEDHIAAEAGALGPSDGALADEAAQRGEPQSPMGRTGAEAIGGAGRGEAGSGTPADRGELGGGGATLGQGGGAGPQGSGSPGGDSRR